MRVLLVASSYLPNVGGVQRAVSQLALELAKRGDNVSVLTSRYPRTLPGEELIDGILITRWHFLLPRLRDIFRGRLDLFFAGCFFFPFTLVRLLWRIARNQPHIVNLHFVGATSLFVSLARRLQKFRFVVSLHGDDVAGFVGQGWLDRWIFRAALARADAVTACSASLLVQAQQIAPGIGSKAQVIYNGIAEPQLSSVSNASGELVVVGRLVPKKGQDVFLRALAELSGSHASVIGDGPERFELEHLVCELGIEGRVQFMGAQPSAQVVRSMMNSQMVVVPSRQESFGLVALEAMALGKPVVASDVGGLPEILQGADAFLVEPDDPFALAQAIKDAQKLLSHNPQWGARNRALATRFSLARMVDEFRRVFLERKGGE